jgi:hypothetical protein
LGKSPLTRVSRREYNPTKRRKTKTKFNRGRKNQAKRQNEAERQREDEAPGWCNLIREGRLGEHLKWLEKRPKEEIINRFFGIINSKSSFLPICFAEEQPDVVIDGIRCDPIGNIQARRVTKITLLLLVKDESQKLGIWNKIRPQWTGEFTKENESVIQVWEALAKQCEDSGQKSQGVDIRKKIEDHKERSRQLISNLDQELTSKKPRDD